MNGDLQMLDGSGGLAGLCGEDPLVQMSGSGVPAVRVLDFPGARLSEPGTGRSVLTGLTGKTGEFVGEGRLHVRDAVKVGALHGLLVRGAGLMKVSVAAVQITELLVNQAAVRSGADLFEFLRRQKFFVRVL